METILCIDDEVVLLDEIVATLEDEGYEVLRADDGAKGLELAVARSPDLIVCDVTMPVMGGYKLVTILRRDHPELADTPIIFLSALADRHDIVLGMKLGADEYLTKPVDFDLLLTKVRACLRQVGRMRVKKEEQLAALTENDALTGLPTRKVLTSHLGAVLAAAKGCDMTALLIVGLDRFKATNDALGPWAGDDLLKAVANRLQSAAAPGMFLARIGGDEFALAQRIESSRQDPAMLAERIRAALAEPIAFGNHSVNLGASIGVAIAPENGTTPDMLIKNASLALGEAKRDGRGRVAVFRQSMADRMQARRTLEMDLRQALERGELELYYQPLVDLGNDTIAGFEALLRWNRVGYGVVSPAEFIPIAEETGLINPIGDWVLETACREAGSWPAEFSVAVNLSPVQLLNRTLPLKVASVLASTGLAVERLELEITESIFIGSETSTLDVLAQLRGLGIAIVMDDFGTGYSSIGYLRDYPFDKVKIDRSFIADITHSEESNAIVTAVRGLADALSMETIAEGIETRDHLDHVRAKGCTYAQGYLFGRPQPAAEIARLYFGTANAASVTGRKI